MAVRAQVHARSEAGDLRLDSSLLPTVVALATMFAKTKPAKAFGEDAIPNLVYARCPRQMAVGLQPVFWKSVLRLEEPCQWKGGQLTELFKGKGKREQCTNSRGIVLADR
eukprot:1807411-Alexandrium_andersonii.AAC.1